MAPAGGVERNMVTELSPPFDWRWTRPWTNFIAMKSKHIFSGFAALLLVWLTVSALPGSADAG
jgi:hypothetical protein